MCGEVGIAGIPPYLTFDRISIVSLRTSVLNDGASCGETLIEGKGRDLGTLLLLESPRNGLSACVVHGALAPRFLSCCVTATTTRRS